MPVIFNAGPLGSNVSSPQVQRQAFLAGGALARGVQQRRQDRAFNQGLTDIRAAQSQAEEMAANPEGPWAEGYDPLGEGIDEALGMLAGELDSEDFAALNAYADQIREEQRDQEARQGLSGRLVELGQMSPYLQGTAANLAAMAQDPSVPVEQVYRSMQRALYENAEFEYKKGQRSAQYMGAMQGLSALNSGAMDNLIPPMIQTTNEFGETVLSPNPIRQQLAAQYMRMMAEAGMADIPGLGTQVGMGLHRGEMGAMPDNYVELEEQPGSPGPGAAGPVAPPDVVQGGASGAAPGASDSVVVPFESTAAPSGREARSGSFAAGRAAALAADREAEATRLKRDARQWSEAPRTKRADFLLSGATEAQALVDDGADPVEAFRQVAQRIAKDSPFYTVTEEGRAPQREALDDLQSLLEHIQDTGELPSREEVMRILKAGESDPMLGTQPWGGYGQPTGGWGGQIQAEKDKAAQRAQERAEGS